jgi:hypothetical protein
MRRSKNSIGNALIVVSVSFVALVTAGLVIQGGGFAIAIMLVAGAILAPLVALFFMDREEREVGRPTG